MLPSIRQILPLFNRLYQRRCFEGCRVQSRNISSALSNGLDNTKIINNRTCNSANGNNEAKHRYLRLSKRCIHFNTKPLSRRVLDVDLYTDIESPRNVIQGYSANGIQINNVTFLGSQLIFPDLTLLWDVEKVEDITKESLNLLIHVEPSVDTLLIGTGKTFVHLDKKIISWLYSYGITADVMSTAHACQTFNVLNQEDRRVAAAVIPVETTQREEIIVSTF